MFYVNNFGSSGRLVFSSFLVWNLDETYPFWQNWPWIPPPGLLLVTCWDLEGNILSLPCSVSCDLTMEGAYFPLHTCLIPSFSSGGKKRSGHTLLILQGCLKLSQPLGRKLLIHPDGSLWCEQKAFSSLKQSEVRAKEPWPGFLCVWFPHETTLSKRKKEKETDLSFLLGPGLSPALGTCDWACFLAQSNGTKEREVERSLPEN